MKTLAFSCCLFAVLAAPRIAAAQAAKPLATPDAVPAAIGTSGTVPTALGPEYQLGPGDKIRVEVYKEEQLSQSVQVRPDGKITMPIIGDIMAAGYTPAQLRDRIATALKDYLRGDPPVSVIVVEALASTVYVIGEVNKPGTVALIGPTTVVQALAIAGGFKDFAKTGDIRILRPGPRGIETLHFNYDAAVKGKDKMTYLERGDTVVVR